MSAEMDQVAAVVLAADLGRACGTCCRTFQAHGAGRRQTVSRMGAAVSGPTGNQAHGAFDRLSGEVVERHFQNHPSVGRGKCVPETEPLGTAGISQRGQAIKNPPQFWIVLNGDSLVFADSLRR